jgi:hypothetical protein
MDMQGEPNLNYVSMFTFCRPILLMGIQTRHMVGYTNFLEERMQLLILSAPIKLDNKDFLVKQALNKALELFETLKHLRLVLKQVDPSKFTEIIYENYIIFVLANGVTSWSPYIGKDKL